jgi:hypothetical protein
VCSRHVWKWSEEPPFILDCKAIITRDKLCFQIRKRYKETKISTQNSKFGDIRRHLPRDVLPEFGTISNDSAFYSREKTWWPRCELASCIILLDMVMYGQYASLISHQYLSGVWGIQFTSFPTRMRTACLGLVLPRLSGLGVSAPDEALFRA